MTSPWTTERETKFILHLLRVGGKPMLEGYLAGFQRRVKWDDMDRDAVREALFDALEAAQ